MLTDIDSVISLNNSLATDLFVIGGAQTYTAFLTAARAMQAKAQADAKLLVKFGLSEAVLAQLGELLNEAVDLLLDDLVARAAQRRLQLGDLADGLGSQDSLANVQVGTVEARAGDRGDRSEVRLPVAVPGGCAEDPDGQRDGDRERDDGELLGAQLVLPARAVLAVEDRS